MAETERHKRSKIDAGGKTSDSAPTRVREVPVGGEETRPEEEAAAAPGVEPEESVAPEPLKELQTKLADLEDQRLRALAELDNYRKRMARQFDEVIRAANDRILTELLDVVDNFERALKHVGENQTSGQSELAALKNGTELIYNQLAGLLARFDVRPIESIGRPFDPNYHEALAHVESAEHEEGIVTAEINKGYMIGSRVLRHARVAVSRGGAKADVSEQKDD